MVAAISQVASHHVEAIQVVVVAMQVVVVAIVVVGALVRHGDRADNGRAEMPTVVVVTVVDTMVVRFQWVGAIRASPIRTSPSLAIANTGDQHRWF